jgi:peptidoglycan/LPS O-acetylase OafA/YrhL
VIAGAIVANAVIGPLYAARGQDPGLAGFTLLGSFEPFAAGMLLAIAVAHRATVSRWWSTMPNSLRAALRPDRGWLVVALGVYAVALAFEGGHVAPWHSTHLATAAAVALLVPLVLRSRSSRLAATLGGSRMLAGLGALSYGLYLWHWPVQQFALAAGIGVPQTWAGWFVATTTVTAISLVPAWLSHRLLEAPLIGWARRLSAPWKSRAVPARRRGAPA